MGYLRKECEYCEHWKKLGEHCGAIMHGMKCVAGPLPPGIVWLPEGEEPNGTYAENIRRLSGTLAGPDEYAKATGAVKDSNPKDIVGTRKAPMSTVSAAVMAEVGVAMLEGALKYGRHNYRAVGVRASVYYDACLRHMFAWWDMGEDIDPASKLSHITKAIAGLMVLRDSMLQGNWVDDRPPPCPEFYEALNAAAAKLVDNAPTPAPKHYTAVNTAIDKAGLGDSHDALTFDPRN